MAPTKITSKLLSWADDLDQGTIHQAAETAKLPIIAGHMALMPDAHLGFGCAIGSVVPTDGAIIPSAVGVDIGCVDADTEFLSPQGWKAISSWDYGDQVMQYDPDMGEGSFVDPIKYIVRDQDEFYHLKTKYGVDQMLTPDHRVLVWRPVGRKRSQVMEVVTADELVEEHNRLTLGSRVKFETTFRPTHSTSLNLTDDELRVQVMFMADGSLERGKIGVIRLKKERKISRAHNLLKVANWPYTARTDGDGITVFRIGIPPLTTKTYADLWEASPAQLRVISEECLLWDGNLKDRVFFTSDKESADFIHYAFASSGYRSVRRVDVREHGEEWRVFANLNTRVGIAGTPKSSITSVPSRDGKAYCFTVPSGFLVLRRGANIFMSGNCGMAAVKTDLVSSDLPDDLNSLRDLIEQKVPAGVGQGNDVRARRVDTWLRANPTRNKLDAKLAATAANQLGSLGSGNHFVEVSLDADENVWVVLHSGSRGVGNKLAQGHIKIAKAVQKHAYGVQYDPELAWFVQGTQEFDEYVADLRWAQAYAWENREIMLDSVLSALFGEVGKGRERERVSCHHNYAEVEHHDGKDVWVTRKGAIRAAVGDLGIIPGSMGTDTFIVEGLGNPLSFNSCSHGAGRRMSRNQARKTLTTDSLASAMGDRTWLDGKADRLVDEHPDAYKDIEHVMDLQSDLVTVRDRLVSVLNYKGA